MSTLEKIAMALHASWITDYDHTVMAPDTTPWDRLSEAQKEYGRKQARAALEALKEPICEAINKFTGSLPVHTAAWGEPSKVNEALVRLDERLGAILNEGK